MSNETNETPIQGRKVGIARFFELLGRDLWPLYKSGILCVLGFLPGTALAVFGMMAGSALLTVVGGVVGGLGGGASSQELRGRRPGRRAVPVRYDRYRAARPAR